MVVYVLFLYYLLLLVWFGCCFLWLFRFFLGLCYMLFFDVWIAISVVFLYFFEDSQMFNLPVHACLDLFVSTFPGVWA